MKSEIEISEIVKRHGGKHLNFGACPSWVSANMQEGLEIRSGVLKSFWIKEGARVYDEPISDPWGKVLVEVLETPKKEEKKPEQVPGGAGTKKCLCGATISSSYVRCKSCDDKIKARAGNDNFLLALEHINWNLGTIAKYYEWVMSKAEEKK